MQMKNNNQKDDGPDFQFESFDVLPSGSGKVGNKHLDTAIEKILKMNVKTKLSISKIDSEIWGISQPTVRHRLKKLNQLGRFAFRTMKDGNKNIIGYTIYCIA